MHAWKALSTLSIQNIEKNNFTSKAEINSQSKLHNFHTTKQFDYSNQIQTLMRIHTRCHRCRTSFSIRSVIRFVENLILLANAGAIVYSTSSMFKPGAHRFWCIFPRCFGNLQLTKLLLQTHRTVSECSGYSTNSKLSIRFEFHEFHVGSIITFLERAIRTAVLMAFSMFNTSIHRFILCNMFST